MTKIKDSQKRKFIITDRWADDFKDKIGKGNKSVRSNEYALKFNTKKKAENYARSLGGSDDWYLIVEIFDF